LFLYFLTEERDSRECGARGVDEEEEEEEDEEEEEEEEVYPKQAQKFY
jgi:hypothetical protein